MTLVLAGCLLPSILIAETGDSRGIVYIVFAVDTEPSRINPWSYEQTIDLSCFDSSGEYPRVAEIMDTKWRSKYADAFGNHPKFSWFIMSHESFFHTGREKCHAVYDALLNFGAAIKNFGDEIGWHYHHADWGDPDGDGIFSWNQITTFNGTEYSHGADFEIAEKSLNWLLAEKNFFPTVFRSGWVWENNEFSGWLDEIIPFDFSANPPQRQKSTRSEPSRNQYDWSQAPLTYSGYHPHFRDHQKPGHMNRWIFRTVSLNNRREWEKIFRATAEGPQILCYTAHTYDNMRRNIDQFLPDLLKLGDSLGTQLAFATATEAAVAISGNPIGKDLKLQINEVNDSLILHASSPTFQHVPYCVLCDSTGIYRRIYMNHDSERTWRYDISRYTSVRIICAACSNSGSKAIVVFQK